ncbi:MAG: GGDEF domain-containing protein [Lachnospiraceae bacterium]|nr:GGDEF domain-containing protein [Lachnospiraceae bacterium]
MKKVIGLLIALIVQSGILSFGFEITVSAQQEISGELEIISNIADDEMEKYLDGFLKKYPDVEIEYKCYSNYESEMKKRIDSGDYGDVLFFPSYLSQNEYGTYFKPLGSYFELGQKYLYLESSKRIGGAVYGVPSSAYTAGILYNKDVFYQAGVSETPKTIDEFLVALKNIKERTDAIPFFTNYSSPWALQFWEYFPYIEMTGDSDYKESQFIKEKNPFLKGSTHYQVYELLYNIVEAGLSEDDLTELSWDDSKEMLNQGEIGCVAIGSWAVSQFKAVSEDSEAIAFMPFPNEIQGRQYMTISTDYCYGISRNSNNPEAAKAYIEYMLDESGFALDHENLSVVRTDPYPDSFGDMENVILLCNNPPEGDTYKVKQKLSAKLNLEDGAEVMRVIEAAKGLRQETFDDIATDWNSRWESSRTPDMEVEEKEVNALLQSVVIDNYEVSFSKTEEEYLKEKGQLKIGYSLNMAPFQYEKEGIFTGLSAYVCELIGENTGLSIEYVSYDNTQEMVVALSEGRIDMIAGMDADGDYDYNLQYSKEYMSQMNVLIKNKAVAVSALENARMAYAEGEKVKRNALIQEKTEDIFATYTDVIAAVDAATVDCTVMNYYTADYYIQELECKNVSVVPLSENGTMCFAFTEDVDTRLISICNKCIYGIPEGNLQVILREYMEPTAKPVTLKRFVEENPVTSLLVVSGVFLLIVLAFVTVMLEKNKSARKQALDVQRYEMLTSLVDEYIIEYDYATEVCFFDHKLQERFAIDRNVKFSANQDEDENINRILQNYHQALEDNKETTQPFKLTDVDGNEQWYRLVFHIIYKNDGSPRNVIGKLCNVQKEVEELQQMEDIALRDPLTGVYNRKGFDKSLRLLEENAKEHQPFSLVVMDLDNFKGVNDTLGHAGGDAVLQLLAGKLQEVFTTNTVIARFGGDEFMLCVYNTDKERVAKLLGKLVKEMDINFLYQEQTRKISISVGAVFSDRLEEFDALFEEADKALYETKERGKNGFVINELA